MVSLTAFPAAYPTQADELDPAESLFLSGARWWVVERKIRVDPLPRLCELMDTAGAFQAAFSLDRLMDVVARAARRQVAMHCPSCNGVSADEMHLLHACALAQAGQGARAGVVLRGCLESVQAVEFGLAALERIGDAFRSAELLFRHRRQPSSLQTAELASRSPQSDRLH